jgi:two-component system NarL family sensor kinase
MPSARNIQADANDEDRTDADRALTSLARRNRELEILNTIAQALNSAVDLHESLRIALESVARLLGLETGWIFLLDPSTGAPHLVAAQNLPSGLTSEPDRMRGTCYCIDTFRAGDMRGAANVNVVTCSRLKWLVNGSNEGLLYHASIPLSASNHPLGMLNLASSDWRELSADDLRILHTVGDMIGIAIERASLYEESIRLGQIEERNRLAREIHDTIAQGLAAITLRLETVDALIQANRPDHARVALASALEQTRSSLAEARRSVLDLRAAPLEGRTVASALRSLAAANATEQFRVEFALDGPDVPLSSRIESGIYRIAQESITNAVRHSQAQRCLFSLSSEPRSVRLRVEDDGIGFDVDATRPGRFGLTGMNERGRLLGGTLAIDSNAGRGTRIELVVPLDAEP